MKKKKELQDRLVFKLEQEDDTSLLSPHLQPLKCNQTDRSVQAYIRTAVPLKCGWVLRAAMEGNSCLYGRNYHQRQGRTSSSFDL